jgi:single-stranded-DNA-specific exonuclease
MYAAGLTLKLDNVPAFRKKFEEAVSAVITTDQLSPQIEVDQKIRLNMINERFYKIIDQMAPFGPGNMQPVFVSENVVDDGRSKVLKEQHLKLSIKQEDSMSINAIGFGMAGYYNRISSKEPFHICYNISENEYNGTKSLQLIIKDIKFLD